MNRIVTSNPRRLWFVLVAALLLMMHSLFVLYNPLLALFNAVPIMLALDGLKDLEDKKSR